MLKNYEFFLGSMFLFSTQETNEHDAVKDFEKEYPKGDFSKVIVYDLNGNFIKESRYY